MEAPEPTVVIADDHEIVRHGLARLLTTEGLHVVAEAADGLEAIRFCKVHKPDLLILDVSMPNAGALEIVEEIRRWSPDTRVVVLTGITDPGVLTHLQQEAVDAILLKETSVESLIASLSAVRAGDQVIDPRVQALTDVAPDTMLTARERQVLRYLARGLTNAEIGERLNVSAFTVKNHRANLTKKLGTRGLGETLARATEMGLLTR